MYKCWLVLVTCASSRAVYLDLVSDCSSLQCIASLKRFIARYGAPETIIRTMVELLVAKKYSRLPLHVIFAGNST